MPRPTRPMVISMRLRLSWHPRISLNSSLGRTGIGLIANNTARVLKNTLSHTSSVTQKLGQRCIEFLLQSSSLQLIRQVTGRKPRGVRSTETMRLHNILEVVSESLLTTFYYLLLILYQVLARLIHVSFGSVISMSSQFLRALHAMFFLFLRPVLVLNDSSILLVISVITAEGLLNRQLSRIL